MKKIRIEKGRGIGMSEKKPWSLFHLGWFTIGWYKYLFEKPFNFQKLFCRMRGHPCGPVYYNLLGGEPDDRCKNCGDRI